MEFYPIDFVIHIINIVVLFVLVRALAYKPIRKFMQAREEKIAAQLADAEAARAAAETLKAEYQSDLDNVRSEGDAILSERRSDAEKQAEEILAAARQQAEETVRTAKADAERAAEDAMRSAEGALANAAVDLAGRVLSFHEAACANAAAAQTAPEGDAEGTVKVAAQPSDEDAAEILRVLENLTGKHLTLKTEVESDLLGGFVAYIEGKVYDFSYASQLKELQRTLG